MRKKIDGCKIIFVLASLLFLLPCSLHARPKTWVRAKLYSLEKFQSLKPGERSNYIKNIQKAVFVLEKSLSKPRTGGLETFRWIESAYAQKTSQSLTPCIVGGVERPRNSDLTCYTGGRSCNDRPNTYRCGVVYNGVCVARGTQTQIANNCAEAENNIPSASRYSRFRSAIEGIDRSVCSGTTEYPAQCQAFSAQLERINKGQDSNLQASQVSGSPLQAQTTVTNIIVSEDGNDRVIKPDQCDVKVDCTAEFPPEIQLGNSSFADTTTVTAPLCQFDGAPPSIIFTDTRGNSREFYKNEDNQICQRLTSNKKADPSLGPDVVAVNASVGKLCRSPEGCSSKIGPKISSRIRALERSKSVKNIGFCGGLFSGKRKKCPPKDVRKTCSKALKHWNSRKCPGGESAKARSASIQRSLSRLRRVQQKKGYQGNAYLEMSERKRCRKNYDGFNWPGICGPNQTYDGYIKKLEEFEKNTQTRFLGDKKTYSPTEVLGKLANYGDDYGSKCSKKLRDCIGEIQSLKNLAGGRVDTKTFCGDDIFKPATSGDQKRTASIGIGKDTLHTDRLVGPDGKDSGFFAIENDQISLKSKDPQKPELKIRLQSNGNEVRLFQNSSDKAAPLLGSLLTKKQACPSQRPSTCAAPKIERLNLAESRYFFSSQTQCVNRAQLPSLDDSGFSTEQ